MSTLQLRLYYEDHVLGTESVRIIYIYMYISFCILKAAYIYKAAYMTRCSKLQVVIRLQIEKSFYVRGSFRVYSLLIGSKTNFASHKSIVKRFIADMVFLFLYQNVSITIQYSLLALASCYQNFDIIYFRTILNQLIILCIATSKLGTTRIKLLFPA